MNRDKEPRRDDEFEPIRLGSVSQETKGLIFEDVEDGANGPNTKDVPA